MAVLCGHASIDERGKTKGGTAGDQTKKEVCTRYWYDKGWSFVLRCKDPIKAEKMAVACERGCANDNIGYDQNQRNTLNTQAKKVNYDLSKIVVKCETDCSAYMTVCVQAAGINVNYNGSNAPTTSTMKSAFTKTGFFEVLTDKKYLTSDKYLKRGDILVKPGSHTIMVLQNGSYSSVPSSSTTVKNTYTKKQFIKDVQAAIGAKIDGIAGPETLSKTVTVSRYKNNKHAVVRPIQKYLNSIGYNCGAVDGVAGIKFDTALRSYQKKVVGMKNPDGEATKSQNTWKKLLGII